MSLNKKASLLFLISLGLFLTLSVMLGFASDNTTLLLILNAFAVSIPAFLIPSIIYRRKCGFERFHAPRFGMIMIAVVIGVGCILLNVAIGCLNSALTYGIDINSTALDVEDSLMNSSLAVMVVTVAIIPAISEEFLMRGALLESWRRKSAVGAVLLTSLLFALLHSAPSNIPVYFAMGVVLALVYNITRNVWLSVTVHFINNLLSVLVSALYLDPELMQSLESLDSSSESLTASQEIASYISGFFSYLFFAAILIVPMLFALRAICRRRGIGMYAPVHEAAAAEPRPMLPLYDTKTGRPLYESDPEAPIYDAQTGEPLYPVRSSAPRFDANTGAPITNAPLYDSATGKPLQTQEAESDGLLANPFIWIAIAVLLVLNIFSALIEFGVISY